MAYELAFVAKIYFLPSPSKAVNASQTGFSWKPNTKSIPCQIQHIWEKTPTQGDTHSLLLSEQLCLCIANNHNICTDAK